MNRTMLDIYKQATKDEIAYQLNKHGSKIKPIAYVLERPWFTTLFFIYLFLRHQDNYLSVMLWIFGFQLALNVIMVIKREKERKRKERLGVAIRQYQLGNSKYT